MNAQQKKKASLVLGILSIITAFGFPVLSIIFGIFGLVLAHSHQKESGLDYKTEKILSIIYGLSSKTQWLSGLYYADFISFYSPTQLCGGGTTKSNSNELPISVPLSFLFYPLFFK